MAIQAVEHGGRRCRRRGRRRTDRLPPDRAQRHRGGAAGAGPRRPLRRGSGRDGEPSAARRPSADARLADTVVFSAHGVSPEVRRRADELGLHTLDATCPLVTKVHSEAKKYAAPGLPDPAHRRLDPAPGGDRHPGRGAGADHRGQRGRQPQARSRAGRRRARSTVPDPEKVVVLTQTTLSVDDTAKTVEILRRRFPELVVPSRDDLCYATKNRQDAVRRIADHVDLFLVVTSDYSSNGMRLLELAESLTGNARRIERVGDIDERVAGGRRLGRHHLGRLDARRPGPGDRRLLPRAQRRARGRRGGRVGGDHLPPAQADRAQARLDRTAGRAGTGRRLSPPTGFPGPESPFVLDIVRRGGFPSPSTSGRACPIDLFGGIPRDAGFAEWR